MRGGVADVHGAEEDRRGRRRQGGEHPARPAPNSAASLAAMSTTAPPASAGRIRIAVGLTPNRSVARLSSGASGGWST